jgi:hypothetical protein
MAAARRLRVKAAWKAAATLVGAPSPTEQQTAFTIILMAVLVTPPAVAVMVAAPPLNAVTTAVEPLGVTEATWPLLVPQVTARPVATAPDVS